VSDVCNYGSETAASVKNGNVGLPGYVSIGFSKRSRFRVKLFQNSLDIWDEVFLVFCVVRTVYFGMKSYNDQRNAKVFNLFMYLLLPYIFRAFF
jgi:hypothetical protein